MTKQQTKEFEDNLHIINLQLYKRRDQWKLTSLAWMDYDDVSQIIRIHIYNKWPQYDPSKPLAPWVNKIISHQIKNLVRNNFSNYAKPCLKCSASQSENGCEIYQTQCDRCPIYAAWCLRKRDAYNIKVPVSLEFHAHETGESAPSNENLPELVDALHLKMEKELTDVQWQVYKALYIKGQDELELAKEMGYKTSEKNRSPGYKQIKNIQKAILIKAKRCIYSGTMDI